MNRKLSGKWSETVANKGAKEESFTERTSPGTGCYQLKPTLK